MSSVATGALVSTVNRAVDAGVTLRLVLWMPVTVIWCAPSVSTGGVYGDAHALSLPPSTLQANVVPATGLENSIGGCALLVNAGGSRVMLTGTISTNVAIAV